MVIENEIEELLKEKGPMTGADLFRETGGDVLGLWRACRLSRKIAVKCVGRRYLRLDRRIEGFARLSPSILREFLTYTVIGRASDRSSLMQQADRLTAHIEEVTRKKSELAYGVFSMVAERLEDGDLLRRHACIIIAGDVVYSMAHDVPRPERSTKRLVMGSDMDIVVVVDDRFPKEVMDVFDDMIYQEKQGLLMAPHVREEIDYVIKDMDRVREQIRFDTFKHMVACKILDEGTLLYGSERLFHTIKKMLREEGITQKLNDLEDRARRFRSETEEFLLGVNTEKIREEYQHLFYPVEESEEFE